MDHPWHTPSPLRIAILVLVLVPAGCAAEPSPRDDDSILGSYELIADGEAGPPGRIDVVRAADGALRAWVHRKYRYWELFEVEVRADSVLLSFDTATVHYHLVVARQASGALGGEISGTQVLEADDYVDTSELSGTVGPDSTAPALTTLGVEYLEDAVDLLPWNPIALELSEPITEAEAAAFAAPGLGIAPRGRDGWIDRFIVTLEDWQQGWSGALQAELADPTGNSAPQSFAVELASVGPAVGEMDFEGAPPTFVWGAVEIHAGAGCESGACALLSAKVSPNGCYAAAGFAFAVPVGAQRVRLRHRAYVSTPTTEGSPSALLPFLFDTPRSGGSTEGYAPASVLLQEAEPGAPEPWAGEWTDVELTLPVRADARTAVRAELGGCVGGFDPLAPSVAVAVEWVVAE